MVARQKLFTYQVTYSIPGISSSKITQKTSGGRHKSSYNIERFKEPSFLLLLQNYIKFRSNFRIPRNSFTCHWIRIASIVLCLDLQSLPTHVSEADQSCGVFWSFSQNFLSLWYPPFIQWFHCLLWSRFFILQYFSHQSSLKIWIINVIRDCLRVQNFSYNDMQSKGLWNLYFALFPWYANFRGDEIWGISLYNSMWPRTTAEWRTKITFILAFERNTEIYSQHRLLEPQVLYL